MACINVNTKEYKTLTEKYKDKLIVDALITNYQQASKTDIIPSVFEVEELLKDRKTYFSLEKKSFEKSVFGNLSKRRLITKFNGEFYVVNTVPGEYTGSIDRAKYNMGLAQNYLKHNGFENLLTYTPTKNNKTFKVEFNGTLFNVKDIIETSPYTSEKTYKDETNILQLVDELVNKFPGVDVKVMSVAQAEYFMNLLPVAARPTKLKFKKVKSFYYDGTAILIKGRVTKDTAVEEVLHPFIESLYLDNQELFKNLHKEAKKAFPELNMQINETYKTGFTPKTRALELVTQSLVRHFNNESENKPSRAWYESIIEFLKWFKDIVKDYYRKYVGQGLPLKTEYISSTATLSDIAKLLNTDKLKFNLVKSITPTAMFSLTPETKNILDTVKKGANEIQTNIIDNLFNNLKTSDIEYDILGLNKITLKDGKYVDVDDAEIDFKSSQEVILGNTDIVERKVISDFHKILGGLATQMKDEDLGLEYLNAPAAERIRHQLSATIYGYGLHEDSSVFIPNVVIGNSENGVADTIDLLKVDPEGVITPIALSLSNFSVNSKEHSETKLVGKSNLFENGVSTKILNNTRSAIQRRLLENLGYKVNEESLILNIEVKGQSYNMERITSVSSTANRSVVDPIIPLEVDPVEKNIIDQIFELEAAPESKKDFLTPEEAVSEDNVRFSHETYDTLFKGLRKFDNGLMTQEEALQNTMNFISMDKGKKEIMHEISISRALIAEMYDNPERIAKIHVEILTKSIKEIREFKEYATDIDNFGKPEYIGKILGMQKFVETYRGLYNISEEGAKGLSQTHLTLITRLTGLLNELVGIRSSDGVVQDTGVFDLAIRNYVENLIRTKSNRDFTEEQLNELMTTAQDIGVVEYQSGTMATSDDALMAQMDKIFKRDRQVVLDKIATRAPRIKAAELALKRLGNKDYDFMLKYIDGEFTGRYEKEIGEKYYAEQDRLYKKLQDEDGTKKTYRLIDDIATAKQEDLDYNKQLALDKAEYADFMRAERFGKSGPRDGKYHRYSKEFKDAREKNEVWFQEGEFGYWIQRASVSDVDFNLYKAKYKNSFEYERAVKDKDGNPTGAIKLVRMNAPKQKFREIRTHNSEGVDMRSEKWVKLHKPETELEIAQLAYYEMWTDIFENELLGKIPENIKMIGKVPVIDGGPQKSLKNKTTMIGRIWANTKTGFSNFVHPSTSVKKVFTDEHGNIITDSIPLMYVGSVRTDKALTDIQNQIDAKNVEYQEAKSHSEKLSINKEIKVLRGQQRKLQNTPSATTLSLDMTQSLLQFSAMAENYEVMSQAEDTYTAMMKVMADRTTKNSSGDILVDKEGKPIGRKSGGESRRTMRARKWLKMTYYGNDGDTKGFFENVTKAIINQTSLAYVGFNIFANVNNYLFGRLSNTIESIGSKYWEGKDMVHTVAEFNGRAMTDAFSRLAQMTDSESKWKPANYNSKYLATVEYFRMMDDKSDMREQTRSGAQESLWRKFTNWGFFLQDMGEFNVQTKVGNAILRSSTAINTTTGETEGLYDALIFDRETGELVLKEGFDEIQIYGRDKTMAWNDDARYEIRNYIREVNIQIHGNYNHEDRMVMQSHALGQMAAQFHKWVAPSIKARFRKEYFDENLGWTEGRYLTWWNFVLYAMKNIGEMGSIMEKYKEHHGDGKDTMAGKQKLQNAMRTFGELGLFMTTIILRNILIGLFEDDDDDSDAQKRLENAILHQADKLAKELVVFNPIPGMGGYQQMYQLFKSPMATSRMLGEMGQALEMTVRTPFAYAFMDEEEFSKSRYIYKKGSRKGELKLGKEWGDAMPIMYGINRWHGFLNITDFYVK